MESEVGIIDMSFMRGVLKCRKLLCTFIRYFFIHSYEYVFDV